MQVIKVFLQLGHCTQTTRRLDSKFLRKKREISSGEMRSEGNRFVMRMLFFLCFILIYSVQSTGQSTLTYRFAPIDSAAPKPGQGMILTGLLFELDKREIRPESSTYLDSIAAFLKMHPCIDLGSK